MMRFSLSKLNARYRNLSEIAHSESAWTIVAVNDPLGQEAYRAILACWSERFLGEEHFAELRASLAEAYSALRHVVGSDAQIKNYCTSISQRIRIATKKADNYLSSHERDLLQHATEKFEHYASAGNHALSAAVLSELNSGNHLKALVVAKNGLVAVAQSLGHDQATFGSISRMLANVSYFDRNQAVIVGIPDAERVPLEQLRRLFLGGDVVKATFVTPNWWHSVNQEDLNSKLWFELEPLIGVELTKIGDAAESDSPSDSRIVQNWDLSIAAKPVAADLEKFVSNGPIECRQLLLPDGLVMPIEVGATRVFVIRRDSNSGDFILTGESPEDIAKSGDVVFSFANVSERSYIREQAEELLGDAWPYIREIQENWKESLRAIVRQIGLSQAEQKLRENGVSKAHRLRWWAFDPDFIRPMLDSDFSGLLSVLGYDDQLQSEIFAATKSLNHARDAAGKVARQALVAAMNEEEWHRLQEGRPAEIALKDVGEASFIASRVIGFGDEVVLANANQVRRILGAQ